MLEARLSLKEHEEIALEVASGRGVPDPSARRL